MKLATGKRIGQSGQEFAPAVLFSFFLHVLVLAAGLFLYSYRVPRTLIPQAYQVALVEQPAEVPPVTTDQPSPGPPAPAQQPKKQAMEAQKAPAKKTGMPELKKGKPEPAKPGAKEAAPDASSPAVPKPQSGVAVTGPQETKFAPYVAIVREKIERNWNPPPGARDARAQVGFRISRSGRVADTELQAASGNFYFDQAAMRAILLSSPFPPLPDGYYRDSMDFSVDLVPGE